MTPLAVAVRRKQWDVVSLYLLLGVSEAANRLPPESLEALLDMLASEDKGARREVRR